MHERPPDSARPPEHPAAPARRSAPPPHARSYVPPPPADAPFWLHPLVLGGAIAAILLVALLLWMLPAPPPSDELTPEELAALMAAPPPPTDLPPRWETPTRPSDLRLDTTPAGASVQLNSEWVGTTPVRLGDAPPGFYQLRVVKPDHVPRDTSFYLASGSFLHLDIRLAPERPPEAPDVSGEAVSPRSPSRSADPVPEVPRRVQQQGRPAGGGVPPTEFEVASPEAVRQASHTGSLSVTSNPSGALVFVDGEPLGRTPLSLSGLRPDTYVVTVALPDYSPLSYQAEVTVRSVAVIKATFPPPSER